jgi:hypothetical protein
MRFPLCAEVLCSALLLGACSSTPTTTTAVVRPTLIAVAPASVFPHLPCSEVADAGGNVLTGYVATLRDVTVGLPDAGTPPLELPSSALDGPMPCGRTTTFSFVVADHAYVADVDGYDRTDLHAPRGDFDDAAVVTAGSRVLLDEHDQPVEPTWSARCGYVPGGLDQPDSGLDAALPSEAGAANPADAGANACIAGDFEPPGVLALQTLTRYAADCIDAVSFRPGSLGWSCGGSGGLEHLELSSGAKTSCKPVACARELVLSAASLAPDTATPGSVTFTVRAFGPTTDGSAAAALKQATCTSQIWPGLIAPATCVETPVSTP